MSEKLHKTEYVRAVVDGMVAVEMQLPAPNHSNLPLPVRNASLSDVKSLEHGKSIYLASRTWNKWRTDFSFGENEVALILRRVPSPAEHSVGSARSLIDYLKRRVDEDSIPKIVSINGRELVHYSLTYNVDNKTIRKASEMYALPLSEEYYLLIAFRFNDPEKQYKADWLMQKQEEARSIVMQSKFELLVP